MKRLQNIYGSIVPNMLQKLGNPQDDYKIIQITGTNGKGSVSSMIYSCLLEAGYNAGLYTKPFLIDKCEKIRVGKKFIDKSRLGYWPSGVLDDYVSALKYFAETGCEYAVIENEIGALTDYTYTLNPYMSIITNVDYDHQNILGNTLEEITYNKCGIYKPCVVYPIVGDVPESCMGIVRETCEKSGISPIYAMEYDGNVYKSGFNGDFQWKNEKIACCAAHCLGIDDEHIEVGVRNVKENSGLRGRWETVCENPKVIVDVGHNMNAWQYHVKFLQEEVSKGKKVGLVFSMMLDRPIVDILSSLPKEIVVYTSTVKGSPLPPAARISSAARGVGLTYREGNEGPYEALQMAISDGCDVILCSGSFFLCGEILKNYPTRND